MVASIIRKRNVIIFLLLALALSLVSIGCSSTVKERKEEPSTSGVQVTAAPSSKYLARYYYFDDVLIPGELKYKPSQSFIYETPQFKAGSMYFTKWRVDVDSLIEFFNYNMEKDNWKIVNSYRGKESFLSYSKPDRTCTIRITEKWTGYAHVEVRVGPVGVKKM